jgi:hypothetical protein
MRWVTWQALPARPSVSVAALVSTTAASSSCFGGAGGMSAIDAHIAAAKAGRCRMTPGRSEALAAVLSVQM